MQTYFQVLLVEDNPTEALLVKQILIKEEKVKFDVAHVTYLKGAIAQLEKRKFDVILLDLHLDDSKGINTAIELLKLAKDTAVIVLSSCEDEDVCMESLKFGAQDYIFKSKLRNENLKSRILYAIQRKKNEFQSTAVGKAMENEKELNIKQAATEKELLTVAELNNARGWMKV